MAYINVKFNLHTDGDLSIDDFLDHYYEPISKNHELKLKEISYKGHFNKDGSFDCAFFDVQLLARSSLKSNIIIDFMEISDYREHSNLDSFRLGNVRYHSLCDDDDDYSLAKYVLEEDVKYELSSDSRNGS